MANREETAADCILDVDYGEACMEEIGLEGLEGITISALWIRLSHRPNFRMTLDDASRSYLWETVVHHADLDFYELPEPRPPLVVQNRFDVDSETGLVLATQDNSEFVDIYPYELVKVPGVFGSCSTFESRRKITDEVRPNQVCFVSLKEAEARWGETLVLVASTERRRRALMGPESNPNLQLIPVQYAMLERIGRSRYLGEVSFGQSVIHSNAKTLFYHRKVLLKNNLITKQVHYHYLKTGNKFTLRNGTLFHITRFYVERRSKIYMLYQELVKHLLTKPDRSDTVPNILSLLGIQHKSLRKAFQRSLKKFAEIHSEPYRKWHPDENPDQWYHANKAEKTVHVIRLHDHIDFETMQRILNDDADAPAERSKSSKSGEGEDEDDDDNDADTESQPNAASMGLPSVNKVYGIPDQSRHILDRSVLHQAYDAFFRAGTKGLSEKHLATVLGVPRLEGRSICRKLLRINAVTSIMRDRGRQKYKNYSAKCFAGKSEHCKEIMDECQKLLEFASNAQTKREEVAATDAESLPVTTDGEAELPSSTFLEDVRKMSESGNSTALINSGLVTSKAMKRANLIVKLVHEAKLFDSPFTLQKVITQEEAKEGHRIDRKSLARLLGRLNAAGLIKSVKSILKYGELEKKVHLICDPSLKISDPLVYSALENAKLKYFSSYRTEQQTLDRISLLDPISRSSAELRRLHARENNTKVEHTPVNGRIYGFEPKFVRMKLLHQYIFYLVYDYGGTLIEPSDPEYPEELREFLDGTLSNMPRVYDKENTWKRFLPSLPRHTGWKTGWCLFSDLLLRMPLSLLTKLLNVNYKIEGLREYLDHPVLRHVPITHLPISLRCSLLHARRYIYRIFEVATRLCYMGLVSFNFLHKEKDHAFFYLHRMARIMDTTVSKTGHVKVTPGMEYPVYIHTLSNGTDVDLYWLTLETICLRTPLGLFPKGDHEILPFELDIEKKPGMAVVIASKIDADIVDDGTQPGDGLGAGGLDSTFFAHLKRNWNWVNAGEGKQRLKKKSAVKRRLAADNSNSIIAKYLRSEANMIPPNPSRRLMRLAINNQLLQLTSSNLPPVTFEEKKYDKIEEKPPEPIKKSRTRLIKSRRTIPRKPYYDDKDMAALKLMTKVRVTWSAKEDSLLLLTKVATLLLDVVTPKRRMVVSWGVIRDFLHSHVEDSKNKTSRACQRRVAYIMLSSETAFNVSVFIGESQDDQVIREICDKPRVKFTDTEEWKKRFEALAERLLVKFKSSASTNKPELFQFPDSVEQLESQYNVVLSQDFLEKKHAFADVKNVVDIHSGVVYSLIIGSVGSSQESKDWSQMLYKIYQQYPESLLRSALAKLRSRMIVSRCKDVARQIPKKTSLSLVSFPYQLSVTYQNMFLSTYKSNVFTEACEFMRSLAEINDKSYAGLLVSVGCSLGCAAAMVSLIHGQQAHFAVDIPENIIVLNVKDTSNNENGRRFLEKFCAWEAEKFGQNTESMISIEPAAKKAKLDETCPSTSTVDDANPASSNLLATNSSKIIDSSADSKETLNKMNSSSRFALYLLRSQLNERFIWDTQHSQDYLAVNACQVVCKLQSNRPEMSAEDVSTILGKLTRFVPEEPTSVDQVAGTYKSLELSDETISEMRKLHGFLQGKRELGAKGDELRAAFGSRLSELSLNQHLALMYESQLILRVGLNRVRYVAVSYGKPWLLHGFEYTSKSVPKPALIGTDESKSDEGNALPPVRKKFPNVRYMEIKDPESTKHLKPIQLLCRPWLKPNGELNRPMLNEMLRSISSHVMCFPGVTHATISEKYAAVLTPVQLIELLEVLEDVGCVRRTCLKQSQKPKLFDPPAEILVVDSDEDDAVVHYHAEVDCIIKLGAFQMTD